MEQSYNKSTKDVLKHFDVTEKQGLSSQRVTDNRKRYGKNGKMRTLRMRRLSLTSIAIPEEPPTPLWELVLEQFKDQLVIILLVSAAISFALALFDESDDWTAFVDPVVVCATLSAKNVEKLTES
jgi:P-type Ca2+ transporter type 2A